MSVAGDEREAAIPVGFPEEFDTAAGFFDDQAGGGDVPQEDAFFKISVGMACGYLAYIIGGGSHDTGFLRVKGQFFEDSEGSEVSVVVLIESGLDDGLIEPGYGRHADWRTVARRFSIGGGGIEFVHYRGINGSRECPSVMEDCNGRAPQRQAV